MFKIYCDATRKSSYICAYISIKDEENNHAKNMLQVTDGIDCIYEKKITKFWTGE